jgi:hypothetical protein
VEAHEQAPPRVDSVDSLDETPPLTAAQIARLNGDSLGSLPADEVEEIAPLPEPPTQTQTSNARGGASLT